MARLPIVLLLAAFGTALPAQTNLSADQFEKTELPALQGMHDNRAAHALAGMKLTERAGLNRAARWQAEMPGKRSSDALTALVDASAFLDPPAPETPAMPPPDRDTQKQILTRAVDQVEAMVHKLPNLLAVRTTTRFETATPEQLAREQQSLGMFTLSQPRLPHHEIGPVDAKKPALGRLYILSSAQQSVTYRDGSEVEGPVTGTSEGVTGSSLGLTTTGEFGPILHMVLSEALPRGLTWSHWEQGATGTLAVFQYDVPKDQSHYEINSRTGSRPEFPAFHGELAIDAASGAILRITIRALSTNEPDEMLDSNILVEYGPVDIGGRSYICPVHGVVMTTTHERDEPPERIALFPRPRFLNDITFSGYHVFRGETRILPAQ